jgi:general secretion pathway protein J
MNTRRGFTLLEILLAMSILSLMGLMVFGSFRALMDTTTRAEHALDDLHLSETLLAQITESLHAAVFFDSDPARYSFLYEKGTGTPLDDTFSWVTRSKAFLPPDFPTREGLNRIELSVQEADGENGLTMRAYSSLLDPESDEAEAVEPRLISKAVKGLELHFYDPGESDWVDDWERNNQLPVTLTLSLYVQADDPEAQMQKHTRRIDIPLGPLSRQSRRGQRQRSSE